MAAKACAQDDVRYAMDAKECPQCGSTEAYEAGSPEHLAALAGTARPAEREPKKPATQRRATESGEGR